MNHRTLMAAFLGGVLAITAAAPCQAQTVYYNPSHIDHDAYGQGYYGGFGRRTNSYFPGSYTSYGQDPYVYNPTSSNMFPKYYYPSGGPYRYGSYGYSTQPVLPAPTYNPYGYSPYGYNPYSGW